MILDEFLMTITDGWVFQGEVSGYTQGGTSSNVVDKFSLSSDGNASDVGDLTTTRASYAGNSSATHYYALGGSTSNVIDKGAFASDANSTDVGDLTFSPSQAGGSTSSTHGYCHGGLDGGAGDTINKHDLSSDSNATDVGNLLQARYGNAGHSYTTHGYSSGERQLREDHLMLSKNIPFLRMVTQRMWAT